VSTTDLLLAGIAIAVAISLGELLSDRIGLPAPVLLTVGGICWAVIPDTPVLTLDPHVVLTMIIPPLLYSAALQTGVRELRADARALGLLSVGLVLATAVVVAVVAKVLVTGMSWPAALALGAVVAPTDAVAALAVSRRAGMPERMVTLLGGESLLNDATALTLLGVAVEAAGGRRVSELQGLGLFVLAAGGGAAVGLAAAGVVILVRRRLDNPLIENALSLVTPAIAFLPAEELHCSGVLAVVVAGLVLGRLSPRLLSSASRIQTQTVWDLVNFVLEAFTFLVLGMQVPKVIDALNGRQPSTMVWAAIGVTLAVLLVRPLWIFPATFLPRLIPKIRDREPSPGWRPIAGLSWAGMRGVVTVAAAFSIPETVDGHAFPARAEVQFLAFVVAAVTLLLEGSTFAMVLRRLGLEPDRHRTLLSRAQAVHRAVGAGLTELDARVAAGPDDAPYREDIVQTLRTQREARANAEWERLGQQDATVAPPSQQWRELRRAMIAVERQSLIADRDSGLLSEADHRALERELDYEERGLTRD
jgi:CPA1 family monovalent cation:H+ antiporter